MENTLISIIVPVYRVELYLDECISSLVDQTYRNLEIILVDDGSPDNCPAMCDAWAERDSRIKVIHKKNGGVSEARNAGLSSSTGEWLVFIDSDDVVSKYLVEALYKEHTGSGCLVVTDFIRFEGKIPPDDTKPSSVQSIESKALVQARGGYYVWGALYNRSLINHLALRFDESLSNLEDVMWNGIYLRYVNSVRCIKTPLYYYRVNPASITSSCIDRKWQVSSWISVRTAFLNWFSNKTLSAQQKDEVLKMYRHCQNNIHAECLTGKITYRQFRQLERTETERDKSGKDLLPFAERIIKKGFPWLYFEIYLLLLRLKRTITGRKRML